MKTCLGDSNFPLHRFHQLLLGVVPLHPKGKRCRSSGERFPPAGRGSVATSKRLWHRPEMAYQYSLLPLLMILLSGGVAHAEWYRVNAVPTYNTITAAKADGEAEPIVIRIRNLEKIEYIQPDSEKVLIGGEEALSLAKRILKGQLVWVENLKTEEGAYIADIYPSFEQVVTAYKEKRIVNGDNISAATKGKLKIIYKQMVTDLELASLSTAGRPEGQPTAEEINKTLQNVYTTMLSSIRSEMPKILSANAGEAKLYDGSFQRALFTADAIAWFREKGQYLSQRPRRFLSISCKVFRATTRKLPASP